MSLVDKLKAYLNEEDYEEPVSERESANSRVRLQAIDEIEESNEEPREKKEAPKEPIKNTPKTVGERAKSRNIAFVEDGNKQAAKKQTKGSNFDATVTDNTKTAKATVNASKSDKKSEARRKKAEKKLEKTLRKKEHDLESKRVSKQDKAKRKVQKIRSEGADIKSLILDGASTDNVKKQAVKDLCEQLVDANYHMLDMKQEYQTVSTYLTDIQRIDELPIEYANSVIDLANKIENLNHNRDIYMKSENLLTEEQYANVSRYEKTVPETIEKLTDMEDRDSMLRSDMGYLEGEKEDLKYMREEFLDDIARIKGFVATVLVLCFIALGVIACVAYMTREPVTVYILAVTALVTLVFAVGYARYVSLISDIKLNDARLAKAVSLLNKVKVKFINNTNTLDYVYTKYGVHSANELDFLWDRYNKMVKDMLRYSEANQDIRRTNEELIKTLRSLGVKEPGVWPSQTAALIDRKQMVEIRHGLNERRRKLRENIANLEKIRNNATVTLRAFVAENPGMIELIQDILKPHNLSIMQ